MCTRGTKAVTYHTGLLSQEIKHHGALNVEAMLARLVATYPHTRRIVLVGTSAGGFGAQLNYPRFAAAFPQAQIDLISRRNKETFEWMSDFVDGVAVNKRP